MMMGFGFLLTLLGLGAVAYMLGLLPQNRDEVVPGKRKREGSALEILKERYARGEITKAEYDQMREDLEG